MLQVIAKAYDNPIPGYKTNTVGNLRLWEALPLNEFDLDAFNKGEYDKVRPSPDMDWSLQQDDSQLPLGGWLGRFHGWNRWSRNYSLSAAAGSFRGYLESCCGRKRCRAWETKNFEHKS